MPAIDGCESVVIIALKKLGWEVSERPYPIRLGKKFLFADLRLSNDNSKIIIVEIKCFPQGSSDIDELYGAIGQYLLYRSALRYNNISEQLFLSIPKNIYDTLLQQTAIQNLLSEISINLIVVDIVSEEIVKWLT